MTVLRSLFSAALLTAMFAVMFGAGAAHADDGEKVIVTWEGDQ
jgi:hypothetical protein